MDLGSDDGHGGRPGYDDAPWPDQLHQQHHQQQQQQQQHHHTHHGYGAPSPHQEYAAFDYSASSEHLPTARPTQHHMDPPPPALQPLQALRPLVVPPWPSTLTSQAGFAPPAPAPPSMPISTPISAASSHSTQSSHSTHSTSTPRRTLTDADRRRMCQYHEDNPTIKQTEIGAVFGVERSTVSKVLRNKDKYLNPDDGSRSPIKRSKGRFPDIERALSNWARNSQRSGAHVTDSMIKEKAIFFANTVGNSESHAKIHSRSWLEKFKQKNHLAGAKPLKYPADAGELAPRRKSEGSSVVHTPNGVSPISPKAVPSPSPLSSTRSPENLKPDSPDGFVDVGGGYRLYNSQSTTSLSSIFTDTAPSSFSAGPTSPTSPFFPSDGTTAAGSSQFFAMQQGQHQQQQSRLAADCAGASYGRQRSQTFPNLAGLDPSSSDVVPPSSDDLTPRFANPSVTGSPRTDSPLSGMPPPPPPPPPLPPPPPSQSQPQSQQPQQPHQQSQSQQSLAKSRSPSHPLPPPALPHSQQGHHRLGSHGQASLDTSNNAGSSPRTISARPALHHHAGHASESGSSPFNLLLGTSPTPTPTPMPTPTPDDARRALELVMTFFQHQPSGFVDPHEYFTIGKLMEKLRVQQGSVGGVGGGGGSLGSGGVRGDGTSSAQTGLGLALPGGLHQIPEHEELSSTSTTTLAGTARMEHVVATAGM